MEGIRAKDQFSGKAWAFVALSLVAHLCFLISKTPSIDFSSIKPAEEEKRILIKLVNNNDIKKRNQVVETQQNKSKLEKPKKAFLGKTNNTFARQTKAAQIGNFKEAGAGSKNGQKELVRQVEKSLKNEKLKNLKFSDLAAQSTLKKISKTKKKNSPQTMAKGLKNGNLNKRGLSKSSDYLEEVPLGDFTRLNTQEFEFYGFYHRIRQKLEQFWGANLQEQVQKIYKSGRSIASGQNLLTSLVIRMNGDGEIIKIQLSSTSGIKELDEVAIDSFNQAGPFPNPPKGMIKDGYATIKWGFAVEAN